MNMGGPATLPPAAVDLPDGSIQAIVVDAHATSRIGLGVLLRHQRWVSRCLLAADRDDAVALIQRHKPDVAVVDVSDSGPFVASYLAPLRSAHPVMPILLGSRCRISPAPSAAIPGLAGRLSPTASAADVIDAVRAALVGDQPPLLELPSKALRRLSEREREVLALIGTGATNREIAATMHLGTETVKKHAGALYRKLGVRNRTEAAQHAAKLLAA
jgi:DNA-binding NarL/FixJ family response regulator